MTGPLAQRLARRGIGITMHQPRGSRMIAVELSHGGRQWRGVGADPVSALADAIAPERECAIAEAVETAMDDVLCHRAELS